MNGIRGIPYGLIVDIIVIILIVKAFIEVARGRVFLIIFVPVAYLLPALVSSRSVFFICFIARVLTGVFCYVYLKYEGHAI